MTYLFFILESKMDVIEDYENEEINEFDKLNDAFFILIKLEPI